MQILTPPSQAVYRVEEGCGRVARKEATNFGAKSMGSGMPPALDSIKGDLLRFMFEMREQGMGVAPRMVIMKSCTLSRSFREKSDYSQKFQVSRWLKRNNSYNVWQLMNLKRIRG